MRAAVRAGELDAELVYAKRVRKESLDSYTATTPPHVQAARKAGEMGMRKLDVIVRGSGSGKDTAIRTLQNMGLEITGIKDVTPMAHNGCRPKKRKGR